MWFYQGQPSQSIYGAKNAGMPVGLIMFSTLLTTSMEIYVVLSRMETIESRIVTDGHIFVKRRQKKRPSALAHWAKAKVDTFSASCRTWFWGKKRLGVK
ncbi:hypothetical protein LKD74_00805 [Intestinimonas sp. CLA-AA-H199]|mgnify:FL=1|nr:hypothetical protein [Intestinimonas aquisgranensis]